MKQAIRHFVIEKASEVFENKGFSATTIEDIAQAADISKPTLYKYFDGKEDIFRKVVELFHSEIDELLSPLISGPEPFPQKLENMTRAILSHLDKNRGIMKIAFHEPHMFIEALDLDDQGVAESFLKAREGKTRFFMKILQEGIDQNFLRDDIPLELVSAVYLGILSEFSLGYILGNSVITDLDLTRLAELINRIITEGIQKKEKQP